MSVAPSAEIHSAAVVEDGAVIGPGCVVGPFAVIGPDAALGADVRVEAHAVVSGATEIGDGTRIYPFASIGSVPQDLKFRGEKTRLVVGRRNRIREGVTMNPGTEGGGGVTRVGDDGLFMANSHVAHDCVVGDRVILANCASLGGHCEIGDDVIVGGLSGVHQRVRVGRGAIIGAVAMVTNDVIPHGFVQGPRGRLEGLNLVGLKRRGVARADIDALRAAYRALSEGDGSFQDRARRLGEGDGNEYVRDVVDFVLASSDRSFLTPD